MHEYGLMEDVVNVALDVTRGAEDRGVACVRIEVGEFLLASRESLGTAFESLTRGTRLAGSRREISEVPGHAVCKACGFEGSAADLGEEVCEPPVLLLCPCCGVPLLVTAGADIRVVDVQLKDRGRWDAGGPDSGGR